MRRKGESVFADWMRPIRAVSQRYLDEQHARQRAQYLAQRRADVTVTWRDTLGQIRDKIRQLNRTFEAKRAAVWQWYSDELDAMGPAKWKRPDLAEQRIALLQAEAEGRIQVLADKLTQDLRDLRGLADSHKARIEQLITEAHYTALHADDPNTSAQWNEANVRAAAIRRELEKAKPAEVVAAIRRFDERGDKVGSYLAREIADELLHPQWDRAEDALSRGDVIKAQGELYELTAARADKGKEADLRLLRDLLSEIHAPVSEADQNELGQRFGVQPIERGPEYGPDLEPMGDDGPQFEVRPSVSIRERQSGTGTP